MTAVRCRTCHWTGDRKTDLPLNEPHPKPCPNGHEVVVGPWPPTSAQTTPAGLEIAFWDRYNVESGLEQQRRYRVNGEKLDSVTTILGTLDKPGVKYWVARLTREGLDWEEELKAMGERGDAAHDYALATLRGDRGRTIAKQYRAYGQAISRWAMRREPKLIDAECMVASVEHGFAGRFDLLCELDRYRVRVDFKSVEEWKFDDKGRRRPPYPENILQLDLYELGATESGYEPADYGLVVRLGPDGEFDEHPFDLCPERGLKVLPAREAVSEARQALREGLGEQGAEVAA